MMVYHTLEFREHKKYRNRTVIARALFNLTDMFFFQLLGICPLINLEENIDSQI